MSETGKTKVAFTVGLDKGGAYGPFDGPVTLAYNKVFTNIGDAYSSSTGVFTAPVAGVYYFTLFFHGHQTKNDTKLTLFKNDEMTVRTSDHQTDYDLGDNGGNAAVLQLQKGDKVYVSLDANCVVSAGKNQTTFSGFQLS